MNIVSSLPGQTGNDPPDRMTATQVIYSMKSGKLQLGGFMSLETEKHGHLKLLGRIEENN